MPRLPTDRPQDSSPAFRRVGLASLLFAVARPRDARAAALGRTALRLTMSLGPREIPMRDIHAVSLEQQWAWGGVRIRTARGDTGVSGLRRPEAATLATVAEEARIAWWREFLVEHADALRAIDARLAGLEALARCCSRPAATSSTRSGSRWSSASTSTSIRRAAGGVSHGHPRRRGRDRRVRGRPRRRLRRPGPVRPHPAGGGRVRGADAYNQIDAPARRGAGGRDTMIHE